MPATTRSAKAERRARRKERRELERRVDRARRSRTLFGLLAVVAFVSFASCSFGVWCAFELPLVVHMLAFSSLTGLFLGATIRIIRERRGLQAGDLPRAPTRPTGHSP